MKKEYNMKKFFAFTLAEVLITLAIVGVVTAMLIPLLTSQIDEMRTKSLFLKQVSLLEQASRQYLNDHGNTFVNQFSNRSDVNKEFLAKYYKTNKVCSRMADLTCMSHSTVLLNLTYTDNWDTGVITADGTYIAAFSGGLDCKLTGDTCGGGAFDINGSAGPNRYGHDVFHWYLLPDKLVFYRIAPDSLYSTSCIKEPNTNWNAWYNWGPGCSMRMLQGLPRWQ